MEPFTTAFANAWHLIWTADADLMGVLALSFQVTGLAVLVSCLIGFPLGAILGVGRFAGRSASLVAINALMGLPPVVVGLGLYLLLSRAGPLGVFGLLYTPTAMVIAQTVLVTPIVAALTAQVTEEMHREYRDLFATMGMGQVQQAATLLWDGRFALTTAALAGTGRAFAEVGAVMIVGGNIDHVTRVMTTTIALETSRGELALALGLGLILLVLSLAINAGVMGLRNMGMRLAHG
ncbi:ABC transporter permease [Pontivivens insulae]|nr:ABC transporter permease [Pontivivens insulae]